MNHKNEVLNFKIIVYSIETNMNEVIVYSKNKVFEMERFQTVSSIVASGNH